MRTARSTFLIEIDSNRDRDSGTVQGQVEHVLTGRTLDFQTWESLRAFLEDTAAPAPRSATIDGPLPEQETK